MRKKDLYAVVLGYFRRVMPPTETELVYSSPFELLVAVVLSAQCTDKRINMVTPRLFKDYPDARCMAEATPEVIYEYIRSVSYPNNKARHLVDMARMLVGQYNGEVPESFDDLVKLPGVGRKTANVVQAIVFKKATMAVDTHVFRVSHRIGLVPSRCTTPYSVEMELMKYIPSEDVASAHFWLLHHGRYTCTARSPHCGKCELKTVCKEYVRRNSARKMTEE